MNPRFIRKVNGAMEEYLGGVMGMPWFEERGYLLYRGTEPLDRLDIVDGSIVVLPPPPVVLPQGWLDACALFKQTAAKMGAFIGEPDYKAGFDDAGRFLNSDAFAANPTMGNTLSNMWVLANEYAKYEGAKLGYGQPEWWYRCWGIDPITKQPTLATDVIPEA